MMLYKSFLSKTPKSFYPVDVDFSQFEFTSVIDVQVFVPAEHQ